MAWPTGEEIWGNADLYAQAKDAYLAVANAVSEFEPVKMVAAPEEIPWLQTRVGEKVELYSAAIEHEWMRDHGPTFVVDRGESRVIGVDWGFNGYGMKALPCHRAARLNREMLAEAGIERWTCPMNLEGGSIHWDGAGTLLTTEECLLHENRNPHMGKEDIEDIFRRFLGIEKTIWLPCGIEDDDTDGHVDEVASFAAEGVVLALDEEDSGDGNYRRLKANLEVLSSAVDAKGRPLKVIPLRQPCRDVHPVRGVRLSMSYVNMYIANGGVVVPQFGDAQADGWAREVVKDAFPGRDVVPVNGKPIVFGGGCIHCITQQMPAVPERPS